MRKVVLNLAVTMDGFIEGPNGEIDWIFAENSDGGMSFFDEFLPTIDAIFYGRVSFEKWGEFQPVGDVTPDEKKLWDSVHSKKKYCFSRTMTTSDNAELIKENITERVMEIKRMQGKDIWLYGGGSLITTFMNLGLIDRFLLAIFPVVLGSGRPLFKDLQNRTSLTLRNVTSGSGIVLLDYERK